MAVEIDGPEDFAYLEYVIENKGHPLQRYWSAGPGWLECFGPEEIWSSASVQRRVALVTGASRGIGRAAAVLLAADGAAVALNYRTNTEAAQQAAVEIRGAGGCAITVQADVADKAAVEALVEQTTSELGPIDILVNNAGLFIPGDLLTYNEEDLDRMWATNLKGVLHCTAAVVPSMIERKYGRVIILSSSAAMGAPFPGSTMYAVTKIAVLILTKRFAFDFGKPWNHGQRCSAGVHGHRYDHRRQNAGTSGANLADRILPVHAGPPRGT